VFAGLKKFDRVVDPAFNRAANENGINVGTFNKFVDAADGAAGYRFGAAVGVVGSRGCNGNQLVTNGGCFEVKHRVGRELDRGNAQRS
jgi:hypothetical protein